MCLLLLLGRSPPPTETVSGPFSCFQTSEGGSYKPNSEWLRSRPRAAATLPLAQRRPDPPTWSALRTHCASNQASGLSARLAIPFPNPYARPKGDVLVAHLDKQAPREPLATAGATSRLLFLGGFVRGVRDNGLGHEDRPFVVRASGCKRTARATPFINCLSSILSSPR